MSATISIITVVYNGAATIKDCIESIQKQDYPAEHIIIDGKSSDKTLEIVNQHKTNATRVLSEPDRGLYDAMNKGIALATGDIIGILNSDDLYASNFVLERIASIFLNPSIEACYGDLVYVEKQNVNRIIRYWKSRSYEDGLFNKSWVPPHPTFFVRRTVYEKYGKFDLNFSLAADFELMLRFMARYNIQTFYIPEVLVKMRLGGSTNKNVINIMKQNKEIYLAGIKNRIPISIFSIPYKFFDRMQQFFSKPTNSATHE